MTNQVASALPGLTLAWMTLVSLGIVAVLIPATIFGLGIGPAVAVHEGSTLIVVANALRLLAYREKRSSDNGPPSHHSSEQALANVGA